MTAPSPTRGDPLPSTGLVSKKTNGSGDRSQNALTAEFAYADLSSGLVPVLKLIAGLEEERDMQIDHVQLDESMGIVI
ncbi:unnamed protein product [Anisakis simplex]|uniref:Transposase n=1 Tax=Anisakis simplex TaxID=6269 RepID=A0A0M3JYR1_ANISI|nr:unnamed protein product [Anisakis simplex]